MRRTAARGGRKAGSISVTYQGSGHPEDLAAFFRSLAGLRRRREEEKKRRFS